MNALEIIKLAGGNVEEGFTDFAVKGLSVDSRQTGKDFCFFACQGTSEDGHEYIKEAVDKGARLVIYEQDHQGISRDRPDVAYITVPDVKKKIGIISAEFFGNPSRKLKVIGITGTNGKTTVSFLIEHIFRKNSIQSGLIGTIQYRVSDHVLPARNTTPGAVKLNHLLHHMVDHGLTHCIMEVSSHALDQYRVQGIGFERVVFTNLTPEHLDYHKSMDDYFKAKFQLFENLDPKKYAVINVDDGYGVRLKSLIKTKVIDYGIEDKNASVRAENIRLGLDYTQFNVITPWGKKKIKSRLIGRHNIYNALAAVAVCALEGIELEDIAQALGTLNFVPGRLERLEYEKPFDIFVDYAHTDDALKNVLTALRELSPRRIITVFGCGGERDRTKRPRMGDIAAKMSDYVILTNDNPRGEQPMQIINEIKAGFPREFKKFEVVLNRKTAIEQALKIARARDFVLIAGKGHETYQIFDGKTIDFDDRKVVEEILMKKQR